MPPYSAWCRYLTGASFWRKFSQSSVRCRYNVFCPDMAYKVDWVLKISYFFTFFSAQISSWFGIFYFFYLFILKKWRDFYLAHVFVAEHIWKVCVSLFKAIIKLSKTVICFNSKVLHLLFFLSSKPVFWWPVFDMVPSALGLDHQILQVRLWVRVWLVETRNVAL